MKILKMGKSDAELTRLGTCHNCKTVFEYFRNDVLSVYVTGQKTYDVLQCPREACRCTVHVPR